MSYDEHLQQEAKIWSQNAEVYFQSVPPDFRVLCHLFDYWLFLPWYKRLFDALKPSDEVLELGCGAGWLSLEMARCGVRVDAIDIAEGAISIAQAYYEKIRVQETITGQIRYRVADVNHVDLVPDHYDWVVIAGMLHHAPDPHQLLVNCKHWLKPGGRVFIFDPLDTTKMNSLAVGAMLMLSPTNLSYGEKIRHLLRVRGKSVQRMGTVIEGQGESPFEGVGRTKSPRDTIASALKLDYYTEGYGITSFLARELRASYWLGRAILLAVRPMEWTLRQLRIIRGLRYIAFASR